MSVIIMLAQSFFCVVGGMYFLGMLMSANDEHKGIKEDDKRESEKLNSMERVALTPPLTERARPACFDEIVGQEKAVKALKVALCGKNPQHILIYGPPGVGKTAAARVALEEAKRSKNTPFKQDAKFIEIDATTLRYDERAFADPLIGSVHDPIYQGAGAYGSAGIPQPKPGAVTQAHGGVLFIDEIGELPCVQLNKLLKVLEDRRVYFESAYYAKGNKNIPHYIHNIFRDGLPADFRLIGATTRSPSELPEALRSRCTEIFFLPLGISQVMEIINNSALRLDVQINRDAAELLCSYVTNGRDAVRILETLTNLCESEGRTVIGVGDVKWAVRSGRFEKRRSQDTINLRTPRKKVKSIPQKIVDLSPFLKR